MTGPHSCIDAWPGLSRACQGCCGKTMVLSGTAECLKVLCLEDRLACQAFAPSCGWSLERKFHSALLQGTALASHHCQLCPGHLDIEPPARIAIIAAGTDKLPSSATHTAAQALLQHHDWHACTECRAWRPQASA